MAPHTFRGPVALAMAVATSMLMPAVHATVLSSVSSAPHGWSEVEDAALSRRADATHVFTLGLTMQNVDQLESKLLSVSLPGSASYGQHLDADDIASTYGASETAVQAVSSWLESSGVVQDYAVRGAFVDIATTVAGANELFNASYKYYSNAAAATDVTKLRTLSYSVPDDLAEHVALVDPGNYFGNMMAFAPTGILKRTPVSTNSTSQNATSTTVDASCQTSITPSCLRQMYNVGNYTPLASSGSRVAFGSFLNQSALYTDTFLYEQLNGLPSQNFSVELIANGTNDQDPATASIGEANLDAQNIIGISHPLPMTEYITGGSPPFVPNIDQPTAADNQNEPYVTYFRYLLNKSSDELPQVISNSYGDEEDSVPYNYAVYTCDLIGLLGLRGVTVLFSSGDLGVGAGCLAPDYETVEFNAIFPASCPYLTSVGGTVDVDPEIAWDGSSGGFSKYFPRPSYQDAAVTAYLDGEVDASTVEYYAPYTNFSGRGFPDVSAHSASPAYQIVYDGEASSSGGTSAAAPVWAGIIALLNDARLRNGQSVLGFLNPLLYTFGTSVLTDITAGSAIGCNGYNTQTGGAEPAGSGIVPWATWNATAGWDPVTGFGTPDFEKLLELVQSI